MFRNYLKIAIRNLLRQKAYSFINIFGLSFGLGCCLLIVLYIQYETSYDRFHTNASSIYRVSEDVIRPDKQVSNASAAGAIGPLLDREFAEVLHSARFKSASMLVSYQQKRFQEENIYFTDSTAFDIFSFPLEKGNPQTALTAPNSIVLSKNIAQKYFGDTDPIGKALMIDKELPFRVTGVLKEIPDNTHLPFDILISMSTMVKGNPGWSDAWFWGGYTYVLVSPRADVSSLEKKLSTLLKDHPDSKLSDNRQRSYHFQPLRDIHLYSNRADDTGRPGKLSNIYLLSFIAGFILLIACINFINLTTAQSGKRAKEVGLRKVVGGTRGQLIRQFLTESILLSLIAATFSIAFSYLLMPFLGKLAGIPLHFQIFDNPAAIAIFLGVVLLVGCLTGSYPAFLLSGFKPVSVLKGISKISPEGGFLRKGLIVFQFSIAIVFISATITTFLQLRFLQNYNLGFSKDQVLVLSFGDDQQVQKNVSLIREELLRSSGVIKATASSHIPGNPSGAIRTEMETMGGRKQSADLTLIAADFDFLPVYNLTLRAGRNFSDAYSTDSTGSTIINETASQQFGFLNPEDAIGKSLALGSDKRTIIGVIKDFHFSSLHKKIEPLAIRVRTKSLSYLSLHIRSNNIGATINDLEKKWASLAPHRPFDYFFLDEQFNNQYQADRQFGEVFGSSALIAIILACLGLVGLVSYTIQMRTKEIGIRKVLGASVPGVVSLLSKDFLRLVLIAILIATPIAWYAMNSWLTGFAYHIKLEWWMFAGSGLTAVVIALLTISFQSAKAALMNPVISLRSE